MARKKAGKNKTNSGIGAALASPELRRVALGLVVALGVGGLAWGALFGVGRLEARAAEIIGADPPAIEFEWPRAGGADASWLPDSERRRLELIATQSLEWRWATLSGEALGDAGRALFETGWFASPPRVRRESADTLRIEAQWRTPGAVVRGNTSSYLVSADGRLLPLVYPRETRLSLRPVLVGLRTPAPMREHGGFAFGEPWAPAVIASGLALSNLIEGEAFADQVEAIDVRRLDDQGLGPIELIATGGGRVVWGVRPGEFRPGEQGEEVKVDRLRLIHDRYGSIDAGRDRLEIFGETVVIDQRALPRTPETDTP